MPDIPEGFEPVQDDTNFELPKEQTPAEKYTFAKTLLRSTLPFLGDPFQFGSKNSDYPGPRIIQAGKNFINNPNLDTGAQSIHDVLGAASEVAAPAAIPFAVTNPLAFTGAAIGGIGGQQAIKKGAQIVGAPEGVANLTGDVGGFFTGGLGNKLGQFVSKVPKQQLFQTAVEEIPYVGKVVKRLEKMGQEDSGRSVFVPQKLSTKLRVPPPEIEEGGRSNLKVNLPRKLPRPPGKKPAGFEPEDEINSTETASSRSVNRVSEILDSKPYKKAQTSARVPFKYDPKINAKVRASPMTPDLAKKLRERQIFNIFGSKQ